MQKNAAACAIATLFVFAAMPYSYAHTTVNVEQYSIEAGWGIEPPVVSYRNQIVFEVTEPGESQGVSSGVKDAFRNLDAVIKFGGAEKQLDVATAPTPGHYFANIIPTRTGTYSVDINGDINGVSVSVNIPVEDAESTAILDFPPRSGAGDSGDIAALKNAVAELQRSVGQNKADTTNSVDDRGGGAAYDYAVFALSLGAVGTVLSVVAMIKKNKK